MALVFAPGQKYLYRHLYTVIGIGGIVIVTGTTVTGRWALSQFQSTKASKQGSESGH